MTTFQFRPTFSCPTELVPTEFIRRVKTWVLSHPDQYKGQFTSEHAMIGTTGKQRHFWSPWLQLEVRTSEQGRVVFGRFTPHPSVFSAIMLANLFVAFSAFFGIMFGVSQQLSGEYPWAYYIVPVDILIALALWLISRIGQNLSAEEMIVLQNEITNLAK